MKKSLKKAVACLLTVLMVVFSVPFTVLATDPTPALTDAQPTDKIVDLDIQFGLAYDNGSGFSPRSDNPYFGTNDINAYDFTCAAMYAPPVDVQNGQLVLKADKTVEATEILGYPEVTSDYTLQSGDFVTVTVTAHGITSIGNLYAKVAWDDTKVTPVGLYQWKGGNLAGSITKTLWGNEADADAAIAAEQADHPTWKRQKKVGFVAYGTAPMNDVKAPLSAANIYPTNVNYDASSQSIMDASSLVYTDDAKYMKISIVGSQNDSQVGTYTNGGVFVNPANGDIIDDNGEEFTYFGEDNVIAETYLFKVVDNSGIDDAFWMYEPTDASHDFEGGYWFPYDTLPGRKYYFTYAYNTYDNVTNKDLQVAAALEADPSFPENQYSRTMYFKGTNSNVDSTPVTTEYTVTFKDADGNTISTTTGATGTAVTIPDLANYGKAADADAHYVAAWDSTPAATIGEADATYTVTYTSAAHTFGSATNEVAASCTEGGSYDEACTVCGWSHTVTTQATGHTLTAVPAAAATCTEAGNSAYWSCSACGKFFADANGENEIAENSWVIAASHQDVQHVEAVAATATTAGNIEYWYCAACGKYYSDANCENEITQDATVIPASGYTYAYDHMVFAENAGTVTAKAVYVAAEDSTKTVEYDAACSITSTTAGTCVEAATATWTATYEGNSDTYVQTLETYGDHQFGDWVVTTEPTNRDAGEETRTCALCGATETRPVAALGFTVTVEGSDLGTISGIVTSDNGATAVSEPLQVGTKYTVTATPNDGVEFVGWQMGNKIVSSNATYSSTIYADVMLIPVYVEAAAETMTVIFYDMYGNLIDTFTGTADDWAAYEYPEAPARPGMVFDKWDTEKEAVTGSCDIWAQYKANEEATKYTVTTSATVTLPDGIVNGEIPYNTKVTVSAEGATAWKIGESVVGYGAEYSFYIAADTAIEPVFDAVTEAPTVTIIGADQIADTKFNYAATMNVPAGFKIVDMGFVYGKNLAEADLDLDKVGQKGSNADSGNVKAVHGDPNYGSDQFTFSYGLSKTGGRREAMLKAFIVTSDGDIIYSDMFTQVYPD